MNKDHGKAPGPDTNETEGAHAVQDSPGIFYKNIDCKVYIDDRIKKMQKRENVHGGII